MTSEKAFQQKVLKSLQDIPGCYRYKAQAGSVRGIPDIIGCVSGIFFGLELKRSNKEKPTLLQLLNLQKIQKAGGIGLVVTPQNWDAVRQLIFKISVEGHACLRSHTKILETNTLEIP